MDSSIQRRILALNTENHFTKLVIIFTKLSYLQCFPAKDCFSFMHTGNYLTIWIFQETPKGITSNTEDEERFLCVLGGGCSWARIEN